MGLEKRDNEEEREGLACPLLLCPRPLVVADLRPGNSQRPVRFTPWVCPEHLLNRDDTLINLSSI